MTSVPTCSVCETSGNDTITIQRCSGCRGRFYCGRECQTVDWRTHKVTCGKPVLWYDKFRKYRDGSLHEGQLELITWPNAKAGTGWGNSFANESDDLRTKFEVEFGGDEEKFHEDWPQGFRWTCCGTDAGMDWGCDHHGSGRRPCTCDFCRSGEPLPNDIYNEKSAERQGLTLLRGPNPRSHRGHIPM